MTTKWATLEKVNANEKYHQEVPETIDLILPFTLLGRKNDKINVDIAIEDNDCVLSRNHCTFHRRDHGDYYITDNKSTNGTYVNYVKVNRMRIRENDLIMLSAGPDIRVGQDIRHVFQYIQNNPHDPKLQGFRGPKTREDIERYCLLFRFLPNEEATGKKRPRSEDMNEAIREEEILSKRKVELEEELENKKLEYDSLFNNQLDQSRNQIEKRKSKIKKEGNQLRRNIELELRCDICQEVFLKPVTLPCGHHLCVTCARDYFNSRTEKECCRCRQNVKLNTNWPIRNYSLDNLIEKLVPYLSEEEIEGFEERKEDLKKEEKNTLKILEQMMSNNKRRRNNNKNNLYFPRPRSKWTPEEKKSVLEKLKIMKGTTRIKYLEKLGYSEKWVNGIISGRDDVEVKNALINFGIKVVGGKCTDCKVPLPIKIQRTKDTLISFIRDEYIDFT